MSNQDEALAIAVEWAKRAEAEAAELRAKLAAYEGAGVRRVTEVVGWFSDVGPHEPSLLVADNVGLLKFADVMPETEGKRGRFRVIVEFTPEP